MKETQIVKLTQSRISPSFCAIVNRLMDGHPVDGALIDQVPEIQLADQCLANSGTDTMLLDQEKRRPMQNGILRTINSLGAYSGTVMTEEGKKPVYDGIVERGRQVHFVMGLPASGKSSALVEVLSKEFGARIIDSDMVKEMIPEYNNGWGASTVHSESKMIMNQSFQDALALGDNIVVPRVGEPPETILEMMKAAKDAGFSVNVHYMGLNANKAMGRMFGRFLIDGRYCPKDVIAKYVGDGSRDLMQEAFETLKNSPYCDGHSEWTNDVGFGEKPILKDHKGISGTFLDDARTDIENAGTVASEDPFVEAAAQHSIENLIREDQINRAKYQRNSAEAEVRQLTRIQKEATYYQDRMMKEYENLKSEIEASKSDKNDMKSDPESVKSDPDVKVSDQTVTEQDSKSTSENKTDKYSAYDRMIAAGAKMDDNDVDRQVGE